MNEFQGKIALITGASEGIGRATAKVFAQAGCDLILVARNQKRLESLKTELSNFPVKIRIQSLDLQDAQAVDDFFQTVKDIDYAVNNAGIEGHMAAIQDLSLKHFQDVFDINVRAIFQCLHHEVRILHSQKKKGALVNLASIVGFTGVANSSLYSASKHAVIGLTRSVAVEQIHAGIRVNCISPGATDTAMLDRVMGPRSQQFLTLQPNQRFVKPEEIADSALWLCSEKSECIVGQNIVIDGGRTTNLV